MDIPPELIPASWLPPAWLLYLLVVAISLMRAPWFRLGEKDSANTLFGAVALVLVFWNLNTGVMPGQSLHYLGASLMTLMFGWEFAFIAVQVLVITTIFQDRTTWAMLAINGLLLGALPTWLTHLLLRLTQRFLPHNYFIYFFINTFIATIGGVILLAFAITGVVSFSHHPRMTQGLLPFLLMLALPEGVLTGMVISILVVYKPEWVTTFRDNTYLRRR